jgi:type II secretory pathway component PulK
VVRHRRGVALILVLSLLVVLGLVAFDVAARARAESNMLIDVKARAAGRYAAESGILMARTAVQHWVDSTPLPPERAKLFHHLSALNDSLTHIALGGAEFDAAVLDLNARIDLNHSSIGTLQGLFSQFVSNDRATQVAAALKTEPVSRFAELARVPGADDALALSVAPYVTIWSDGLVDINTAPEAVLAALPGIGRAVAQRILSRRDAGEVFTSSDTFRPTSTGPVSAEGFPPLTVAPTRVMLVSRGWRPGSPITHEIQAVYVIVGDLLVLQNWEERDR